jgi:hypothetical protein
MFIGSFWSCMSQYVKSQPSEFCNHIILRTYDTHVWPNRGSGLVPKRENAAEQRIPKPKDKASKPLSPHRTLVGICLSAGVMARHARTSTDCSRGVTRCSWTSTGMCVSITFTSRSAAVAPCESESTARTAPEDQTARCVLFGKRKKAGEKVEKVLGCCDLKASPDWYRLVRQKSRCNHRL